MKKDQSHKVEIIALGQNCMPRTILTRWGIKPKKIFGELSYPFDFAVFETREITRSIKTDFEEFLFNLNYCKDKKVWAKEPDCIEFVHETNFKENDKEKLVNKYLKRIENFKTTMKNPNPIIFVQILGDCSDIENLYNELKNKRKGYPFKLIVVDTQNITKPIVGINVLKLPFPSVEYKQNWWKKKYYSSREGKIFEKQICDFVSDVIKSV